MKIIYHSACNLSKEYESFLGGKKIYILRSFYNTKNIKLPNYCKGIFLDSGAFSAFRSGAKIDLNDYISFLKTSGKSFDAYANLDVIGNAEASLKNQEKMDKAGLFAIPTFHYGEDFEYLKFYIKKYSYVALGGMVPLSGSQFLRPWIDSCWKIIGGTKVKIHGFGLTNLELVQQYPWHSIDSTTASRAGRTGVLLSPWGQLRVSSGIKIKSGASIISPMKIEKVLNWANKFSFGLISNWDQLSSTTKEASQLRIIINILFLENELQKKIRRPNLPFKLFF